MIASPEAIPTTRKVEQLAGGRRITINRPLRSLNEPDVPDENGQDAAFRWFPIKPAPRLRLAQICRLGVGE
jgi:hypothetical protein